MALNPSGPISIGGATAGQSINLELGRAATATSSLNETALRTLAGVPSGQISLSNFYGKSNAFTFNLTGTTVNLRTAALAAGWNGSTKVIATVGPGIAITSSSTGSAALTVNGAFPGGVDLVNNGTIVGRGGAGGRGGSYNNSPVPATAGGAGGIALSVSTAITITNNGTVAGGGGGGGGGGNQTNQNDEREVNGGGGGGGAGNGTGGGGTNPGYFDGGSPGNAGTPTTAGTGGPSSPPLSPYTGGNGGNGGGLGAAGSSGQAATGPSGGAPSGIRPPGGGGAAGACTSGNSNITWAVTGTRLGALN
jgi:hypothetical protein